MNYSMPLWRKKENYFSGLLLLLILGSFSLILLGKSATFISLNSYHPFWLNVFFINYTFIGDGIFAICLIALYFFYFKRKKKAIALLYSFLLSGLAVQVIKNLVNSPRPKLYFEEGQYMFFMDGISLSNYSSFPSGHTATAFAIATVLILFVKNKNWQLPILLAAALVGYSRIYLAQHFLIDVIIGAIIGSVSGMIAFYLATNLKRIRISFRKMYRFDTELSGPVTGSMQPV
jgi:membrane-associated phospholipid phosphatase